MPLKAGPELHLSLHQALRAEMGGAQQDWGSEHQKLLVAFTELGSATWQ